MDTKPMTLRQHRASRILTMRQLAKMAGVGTQSIVKIERGEKVRPSVYGKIANSLGIDPHEIREFTETVSRMG